MKRSLCLRHVALGSLSIAALLLLVFAIEPTEAAKRPAPAKAPSAAPAPVDLFKATADNSLDIKFVPADEKRGVLMLRNRTRQPLAVEIPDALAAVPVLAQHTPILAQFQSVGFSGQLANGLASAGDQPARLASVPEGILAQQLPKAAIEGAVAPAKTRTLKLAPREVASLPTRGVCLNLGLKTPHQRVPYRVVRVAEVSDDPRLAKTISLLGDPRHDQNVLQAVAWHLANGKTARDLAKIREDNGRKRFSDKQLRNAAALVATLSKPNQPPAPAPVSPAPQASESLTTAERP